MKNIFKISTLSIITILALSSCGGGSSTSSNDSTTPMVADTGSNVKQGYFVDSGVEGLDYNATPSGKTGVTDENGSFDYVDGDIVRFSVGNLELGEAEPAEDGLVTPKNIIPDDIISEEDKVEAEGLMLRVLQSIDADNNPENGIEIPKDIREEFSKPEFKPTLLSNLNEEGIIGLHPRMKALIDENGDGIIDVDLDKAIIHHDDSKNKWVNGEKPGVTPAVPNVDTTTDTEVDDNDVETPDVDAPDFETPDVETPDVDAPDFETPDVETPDFDINHNDINDNKTPNIDINDNDIETPDVDAPDFDINHNDINDIETPDVDEVPSTGKNGTADDLEVKIPDNNVFDVETPDVETPDVETPDVETPDVETPDVETPDVETPDAETTDVETTNAETTDAETTDDVEEAPAERESTPSKK